jgi:DNA-directed RNA polymerase specialized sigma24 family protein
MSHTHLDDPTLRGALRAMVRRRVPASDVDDVVQSTLVDAVAAPAPPADREQLRRWVFGIARHKIVDAHRARRREVLEDHDAAVAAEADEAVEAATLLRWAERELPKGEEPQSTLGLMLREGQGEALEHLAADAHLPAATLRQRVRRLRQHFRARWALQVAAVIALVLGGLALYSALAERREIAIHPLVGEAPAPSMGAPSPSASVVTPRPTPSTTASTASSTTSPLPPAKAPAEPPAPAPKKMKALDGQREAPLAPQSKAKDTKASAKPAPEALDEKSQASLPNAPADVKADADADALQAGPTKESSKRPPKATKSAIAK